MKLFKGAITCALVASIMMLSAASASAVGIQEVIMHSGLENSIEAGFMESHKGTGDHDTDTTRVIKQCYVRLREGNYDSGRQFSEIGAEFGGNRYLWTPVVSRLNNPFETCYMDYGWLYY